MTTNSKPQSIKTTTPTEKRCNFTLDENICSVYGRWTGASLPMNRTHCVCVCVCRCRALPCIVRRLFVDSVEFDIDVWLWWCARNNGQALNECQILSANRPLAIRLSVHSSTFIHVTMEWSRHKCSSFVEWIFTMTAWPHQHPHGKIMLILSWEVFHFYYLMLSWAQAIRYARMCLHRIVPVPIFCAP